MKKRIGPLFSVAFVLAIQMLVAEKAPAQDADSPVPSIVQGVRDDVQRRLKENQKIAKHQSDQPHCTKCRKKRR